LAKQNDISEVCWNRPYDKKNIELDKRITLLLDDLNIKSKTFNGSLLWEPWDITKKDKTYYKVFTPFYKNGCLKSSAPPKKPCGKPQKIKLLGLKGMSVSDLNLLPNNNWHESVIEGWDISESGAHKKLNSFLSLYVDNYKDGRNYPDKNNVSRLSPYLHFGQVSPNQVWYMAKSCSDNDGLHCFLSELGWREFSYSLLYRYPEIYKNNIQKKFDNFPWKINKKLLILWQQGKTGYPIVDAGMRELWQTGYMHGRVRMIVASFLVKNLLIHWKYGAAWFWDCLFDADLASNSASWQWVAGCGMDAAPYFRIFNPVLQGEKFDKSGCYIKKYVPELKRLSGKHLFSPWEAPKKILDTAGIVLGKTYPRPIVELSKSRALALDSLKSLE
jgi:deoxyribodipyrimidine photo-lyase